MSEAHDMRMDSAEGLQQPENNSNRHASGTDDATAMTSQSQPAVISGAILRILHQIPGENADRQGLRKTPDRYAKALLELTKGYGQDVDEIVNGALFDIETEVETATATAAIDHHSLSRPFPKGMGTHGELVVQRDIGIFSLCEHHMLPFFGKLHIAYISGPNGRVIGLSKLARIADMFARRLQVQERLTCQVAETLERVLDASGVAVAGECTHLCMAMRGVQKVGAVTVTESMRGVFREDLEKQRHVMAMLGLRAGA